MAVKTVDVLNTFGTLETVERPKETAGGLIKANDKTAKAPLGVLYRHKGNVYRYVQHNPGTAVAVKAGGVAYWKTLSPADGDWVVSSDQTDSIGGVNAVAGIYVDDITVGAAASTAFVTAEYYTWIGVGGVFRVQCAASVVAGDKLIGGTTDLQFERVAAGTQPTDVVFGIALATRDVTSTSVKALLQALDW